MDTSRGAQLSFREHLRALRCEWLTRYKFQSDILTDAWSGAQTDRGKGKENEGLPACILGFLGVP